jgi:Uma2 family endonuclease
MSTITPTQPMAAPMDPAWVPSSSLYPMTLPQYEAMIASGTLNKRDRVHLINGYLVAKMPESPSHGMAADAVQVKLGPLLPAGFYPRIERSLMIPSYESMPEPDVTVVRGTYRDYANRYPIPTDVALLVEVAHSSLADDRAMAGIYAAGGIPVYWIVNLVDRQVEVYTSPGPAGYQLRMDFAPGQAVPVIIDGQQCGQIPVDDLLP